MATTKRINDFTNMGVNLTTPKTIKLLFALRQIKNTNVTCVPYSPVAVPLQCQNDLIRYTHRVILTEGSDNSIDNFLVDAQEGTHRIFKYGKHIASAYGYEKIQVIRTALPKNYYEYKIHYFISIVDELSQGSFREIRENFDSSETTVLEYNAMPQMFGGNPLAKAFNVFSNVDELAEETSSMLPKVGESLNNFNEFIAKCSKLIDTDSIHAATSPFTAQINKVTTGIEKLGDSMNKSIANILLIAAAVYHMSAKSMTSTTILLGVGIWCLTAHKEDIMNLGMELFTKLSGIFSGATAQASTSDYYSKSIIMMLIGLLFAGSSKKSMVAGKVLHIVGDFSKYSNSFEAIITFIVTCICNVFKFMDMEDYLPSGMKHFGIASDELKSYLCEVDEVIARINSKRFLLSLHNYHQVKDLKKRGDYICAALRVNSHDYKSLSITLSALAAVVKYLEKRVNLQDNRVEPRVYRFTGGSGNFKTQMSQHLAAHLVIATSTDEERLIIGDRPMTAVYNLCEATAFADGYDMSKKIILIDDIDQFRTEVGDLDSIWAKIWAMCTELPGQTHQASLEDKGLIVWNSPIVITTSNVPIPPTDQVRDANALKRRIARAYYVYPKDEYCKNPFEDDVMKKSIDVTKLPRGELDISDSHPRVLMFQPYSTIDGAYSGPPRTYDEVCADIISDYDEARRFFAQKTVSLKATIEAAEVIRLERVNQLKNVDLYSEMDTFIDSMNKLPPLIDHPIEEDIQMEAVPQSGSAHHQVSTQDLFFEHTTMLGTRMEEENPIQAIREIEDGMARRTANRFHEAYIEACDRLEAFTNRLAQQGLNAPYGGNFVDDSIMTGNVSRFDRMSNRIPMMMGLNLQTRLYVFGAAYGTTFWHDLAVPTGFDMEFEVRFKEYDFRQLAPHMIALDVEWNPNVAEHLSGSRSWYNTIMYFLFKKFGSRTYGIMAWLTSIGFIMSFTLVYYGIKAIIGFVTSFLPSAFHQSNYSGRANKRLGKAKFIKDFKPVDGAQPQMGHSPNKNGLEKIEAIVNHNQYSICLTVYDEETQRERYSHQTFGFFVKGNVFLAPYHLIEKLNRRLETKEIEKDFMLYLIKHNFDQTRDVDRRIKLTVEEFMANTISNDESYSRDACLYVLPRRVKPHRDFSDDFVDRDSLSNLCGDTFSVRVINQDRPGTGRKEMFCHNARMVQSVPLPKGSPGISEGAVYHLPTLDGDCGSIVQVLSNSMRYSGKIFGFHTGGDSNGRSGYSNWLPKEMIRDLLDQIEEPIIVQKEFPFEIMSEAVSQFGRRVLLEATPISKSPTSTAFIPSVVFEMHGKAIEKPTWLREFTNEQGDCVDPKEISQLGYSPEERIFNQTEVDLVVDAVFRDIRANSDVKFNNRILSDEEAIAGIIGEDNIDSLNFTSSPGWPFTSKTKKSGKRDFFGDDGSERSSKLYCELMEDVRRIIDDASIGIRGFHCYADHLKDETRPIDKVELGKTRNFSSMPINLNLPTKKYFGAFIQYIMSNHTHNSIAVGINPYSDHWDFLGKRQSSRSGGLNCIAGDFGKFDKFQFTQFMLAILRNINELYDDGPTNKLIREVLFQEVIHSRHINGKYVCEWVGSLPSGHNLTTILNSIYNLVAHRWCWYMANDRNALCLSFFEKHVSIIVFGDDSHLDVDDEFKDIYNELTLPNLMLTMGLNYTNETKNVSLKPVRPLFETSFLKRTWRFEPKVHKLVAPLEMSVVLHMTDWSRKGEYYISGTKSTIDIQMKELSLHGEELFKKYAPTTISTSDIKLDYTPQCLTWYSNLVSTRGWNAFF